VIHRDLKPSNIMLGNYGEVYVLDWGLARIEAEAEPSSARTTGRPAAGDTESGAMLGTLGYMSPEQMQGEPVGPPTDIYALGAILFELLAREPLHPRGMAAIANTLDQPDCSPARRRPDRVIAPELDEVCVAALSSRPGERPSAHELADRIQRYLDGDRDLARRRTLAAERLAVARAAVDSGDPGRRADAMRAAGQALALDPESQDAALLVGKLMIEVPSRLSESVRPRLRESDRELGARQHAIAAVAMASVLLFAPLVLWVGVRDWILFALVFALIGVMVVQAAVNARRRSLSIAGIVACSVAFVVVLSRFFGPFVIVPGIAGTIAAALLSFPTLIDRPWIPIGAMATGFVAPLICEATGAWSPTWAIIDNQLLSIPSAIALDPVAGATFLIVSNLSMIVIVGLLARSLAESRRDLHVRLDVQAWHLEQLLPRPLDRSA
jgi:serine/threonine-protein kinase